MHVPNRRARTLFIASSAAVLVAFGLVLAGLDATRRGPEFRTLRLMPAIGAELVDRPLTEEQATWSLETVDGRAMKLGDMPRDTVVFLNFWATWCAPCREELPSMLELRNSLQDRRFIMAAVSYDESWADIRGFFARWLGEVPTPQQLVLLRDPAMGQSGARLLRETFGTEKLPETWIIRNGRVLARFVNARAWTDPSIVSYFQQLAPLR